MSTNTMIGGAERVHVSQHTQNIAPMRQQANPAANTPKSSERRMHNLQEIRRMERQGEVIPISDEQLIRAIERAIKAVQGPMTSLDFSVHQETKQIMVKVLDRESGEIIREIPPEKSLDLLAKLWQMAGILVDERR